MGIFLDRFKQALVTGLGQSQLIMSVCKTVSRGGRGMGSLAVMKQVGGYGE